MKKNILLFISMLFILACETGTRYETNESKTLIKTESLSGLVNRYQDDDIKALLEDKRNVEVKDSFIDDVESVVSEEDKVFLEPEPKLIKTYAGGVRSDGLDVRNIRTGQHKDYIRLVFDVYNGMGKADRVGTYTAKYTANKDDIEVIINGYREFSASLPSFKISSAIKQLYFEKYLDDSGFKLHIKLRTKAEVRIFELRNPAKLVFDIKPI